VDWHEWGAEALEKARQEDKPIFLSIGYSACHWCHVMERESFENEEIARVMNLYYVCVKVDRKERPDLDDLYMIATQALTGSGGWPMSVWLTPDGRPFYAGTYFPPESRYGRPGFKEVLLFLARLWREDRSKIIQQANALTDAVRRLSVPRPADMMVPHELVIDAAVQLARTFDPVKGGIITGGAIKFPPCMALDLMLRAYHHLRNAGERAPIPAGRLLKLVEITLEQMARGGIYDHLGGGFARYSTDADWLVPHFEKMLYDQALLADIYLKAYQLTGKALYARVAGEVLDYVIRDLQGPEGGFYCTRDADSEGAEGKFYVWSKAEVLGVLGPQDGVLFCDYYDVTETGNWEGRNILHVLRPPEVAAKLLRVRAELLESRLREARRRLYEAREKRVKPYLDDKVLASWNGLMIGVMAKAHRILGDARYHEAAVRGADFVLNRMVRDGRLLRTYRAGRAHALAYLDDYAFTIEALLNLYEATFETGWLEQASTLNDHVLRLFADEHGGFFSAANDAEKLLIRAKDAADNAVPSGNSVQLMNLLRLATLLERNDLRDQAEKLIRAFGQQLAESPHRSERMLCGLDFYHRGLLEVAFVAYAGDTAEWDALMEVPWRSYLPNVVLAGLRADHPEAAAIAQRIPLLADKKPIDGRATAYVCRNHACQAPTCDPEELRQQLTA
jgi:hypothetical protein